LLLIVPAVGMIYVLAMGTLWSIHALQSTRCLPGTFLNGSGRVASIVLLVATFLLAISLALPFVNWLAHTVAPSRRFFERKAREFGEPGYEQAQRPLITFLLIESAIMVPILIAASCCQYCLSPTGILYQPWPWSDLRHYTWHDVRRVETSCRRDRGKSWNTAFSLVLSDGTNFDIMDWPKLAERAYPDLIRALNGIGFVFDASHVRADCGVPYAGLLMRRP
jgi:hypothetical protein